jgi:hypothetical protein
MIYELSKKDINIITQFVNNRVFISNIQAIKECYKEDKKNKIVINSDSKTLELMNKAHVSVQLFQNEITRNWSAEDRENNAVLADIINLIIFEVIQLNKLEREEIMQTIDAFFIEKMKLKELAK